MGGIAHDVDAALAAGFGAFRAFAYTGASSAEHVVGASVVAGTAVVRIGLQIHTGPVAVGQTRVTTRSASGAVADMCRITAIVTVTTVVGIAEGVRELAAATRNTGIAGHTAFAAVA